MWASAVEATPLRAGRALGKVTYQTIRDISDKGINYWEEFHEFLTRSSVVELALGIVIGTAFQVMVNSLLSDIILPPTLGVILGDNFVNKFHVIKSGKNGPHYATIADAQEDGAITINYGRFSQLVLNFLVIVLILFMLIKAMQEIRNKISAQASTKQCPFCYMRILAPAIRCPHCTSYLESTSDSDHSSNGGSSSSEEMPPPPLDQDGHHQQQEQMPMHKISIQVRDDINDENPQKGNATETTTTTSSDEDENRNMAETRRRRRTIIKEEEKRKRTTGEPRQRQRRRSSKRDKRSPRNIEPVPAATPPEAEQYTSLGHADPFGYNSLHPMPSI